MIKCYKDPIKLCEYEKWLENKFINPRTKRIIKKNGVIYKYLDKINIKKLYLAETVDDKDIISLCDFWIIKDSVKYIVYENIDNLIFYKDSENHIRCFEKESVEYMLGYNIKKHPVTGELFPDDIFINIISKKLILEKEKTISELTLDVFQLFGNNSFFIDHNLFLELSKNNLLKLYFEISNLYKNNFSNEQRNEISNKVFILTINDIAIMSVNKIQKYILLNIKILLEYSNDKYKYMINYILIGGLSIVINEIRILYPSFSFLL
jgi:hypothetical protein